MQTFVTHSGSFHLDEAFAFALARLAFPGINLVRTRDAATIAYYRNQNSRIILDVGTTPTITIDERGLDYDHHFSPHYSEVPASASVAADYFAPFLMGDLSPTHLAYFRQQLVALAQPIDDADKGIKPNDLSIAFSSFNQLGPTDEAFLSATDWLTTWLQLQLKVIRRDATNYLAIQKLVKQYPSTCSIAIPSKLAESLHILAETHFKYILAPHTGTSFRIRTIPEPHDLFQSKTPLPLEWTANPPEGLIFIHPSRFLAVFKDRPTAAAALATLLH